MKLFHLDNKCYKCYYLLANIYSEYSQAKFTRKEKSNYAIKASPFGR